jgi:hypothetical protein
VSKESENLCEHKIARRGPGSAYAWVSCAHCGKPLGITVPVATAVVRMKDALKTLEDALEWQKHDSSGTTILPHPMDRGGIVSK